MRRSLCFASTGTWRPHRRAMHTAMRPSVTCSELVRSTEGQTTASDGFSHGVPLLLLSQTSRTASARRAHPAPIAAGKESPQGSSGVAEVLTTRKEAGKI